MTLDDFNRTWFCGLLGQNGWQFEFGGLMPAQNTTRLVGRWVAYKVGADRQLTCALVAVLGGQPGGIFNPGEHFDISLADGQAALTLDVLSDRDMLKAFQHQLAESRASIFAMAEKYDKGETVQHVGRPYRFHVPGVDAKVNVQVVDRDVWIESDIDRFEGIAKVPLSQVDALIAHLIEIQKGQRP